MKEFTYTLLEQVARLYAAVSLENVLLLASQHLLEPQKRMFELLLSAGLKPGNCIIAGKSYSTNREIMRDLIDRGCVVAPFSLEFDPLRPFDDWFEENLNSFVGQETSHRQLENYHKVIVLDDGGFMHLVANRLFGDLPNVVGIEQTSSGHSKIQTIDLRFPTSSVARSYHKLIFESPHIGRNGYERIVRHLKARGKSDPNVLVVGLGPIGRQVAGQLFLVSGYRGYATDRRIGNQQIMENGAVDLLRGKNKLVSAEMAIEKVNEFDVIVCATGSPVFTESDINRLHPEVSLISISSSDREFPAALFRHAGGNLHEEYYQGARCLVNGGFPITFDGNRHAMPPRQIEFTIALLLTRVMDEESDHLWPLSHAVEQIRAAWSPYEGVDEWYQTFANGSS